MVLACARVELKFVVNTPLPFVDPEAGTNVLFAPLDAIVTGTVGTVLLN